MTLPLILATLLACSDKGGDTGTGGIVTDSGDGGTEEGPCGQWSSIWQVDAEWRWELDSVYQAKEEATGGWKIGVTDTEIWDGKLVYLLTEEVDFQVEGYDNWEETNKYRYECLDGDVVFHQFEGVYERDRGSVEDAGWWAADLDEPQIIWPRDIAVGQVWGWDTSYTLTYSGSAGTTIGFEASYEALSQTTVTVPAGSFDVIEVAVSWSTDPRREFEERSWTSYVAREVGEVKIADYAELVEWDPNPEFTLE